MEGPKRQPIGGDPAARTSRPRACRSRSEGRAVRPGAHEELSTVLLRLVVLALVNGGEHEAPRTPQDLTADDCLLVGLAGSPDVGAGCAFAMANRYQQTMRPTSAARAGHLARCEGYRRSQGISAADFKLKRRLWLACLAGLTMRNVEPALAGLRQLRAASFAASCAEFASDPVAMGACLSPALIPSGALTA